MLKSKLPLSQHPAEMSEDLRKYIPCDTACFLDKNLVIFSKKLPLIINAPADYDIVTVGQKAKIKAKGINIHSAKISSQGGGWLALEEAVCIKKMFNRLFVIYQIQPQEYMMISLNSHDEFKYETSWKGGMVNIHDLICINKEGKNFVLLADNHLYFLFKPVGTAIIEHQRIQLIKTLQDDVLQNFKDAIDSFRVQAAELEALVTCNHLFYISQVGEQLLCFGYNIECNKSYLIGIFTLKSLPEVSNPYGIKFLYRSNSLVICTGSEVILLTLREFTNQSGEAEYKEAARTIIAYGLVSYLYKIHNEYIGFYYDRILAVYHVNTKKFLYEYPICYRDASLEDQIQEHNNRITLVDYSPETRGFRICYGYRELPLTWLLYPDSEDFNPSIKLLANTVIQYPLNQRMFESRRGKPKIAKSYLLKNDKKALWITAAAMGRELQIQWDNTLDPFSQSYDSDIIDIEWAYVGDRSTAFLFITSANGTCQFIIFSYEEMQATIKYQSPTTTISKKELTHSRFVSESTFMTFIDKDGFLIRRQFQVNKNWQYYWLFKQRIDLKAIVKLPNMSITQLSNRVADTHHIMVAVADRISFKVVRVSFSRTQEILEGQINNITHMAFSATSRFLAITNNKGELWVYDLDRPLVKPQEFFSLKCGPIHHLSFIDADYLLFLAADGVLRYLTIRKTQPKAYEVKEANNQILTIDNADLLVTLEILKCSFDKKQHLNHMVIFDSKSYLREIYSARFEDNTPDHKSSASAASSSSSKEIKPANLFLSGIPQPWQVPDKGTAASAYPRAAHMFTQALEELSPEQLIPKHVLPAIPAITWQFSKRTFPAIPAASGPQCYEAQRLSEEQALEQKIQRISNSRGINTNDFICWDREPIKDAPDEIASDLFKELASEGAMVKAGLGSQGLKRTADGTYYILKTLGHYGDFRAVAELLEEEIVDGVKYRLFRIDWIGRHTKVDPLYS